jgi:hypothetical protein
LGEVEGGWGEGENGTRGQARRRDVTEGRGGDVWAFHSRVEGVDDQAHQLGDLRLEREGLNFRHDDVFACVWVRSARVGGRVGGGRKNVSTWVGVWWDGRRAKKNVADAACQARVNEHVWMMEWCVRAGARE